MVNNKKYIPVIVTLLFSMLFINSAFAKQTSINVGPKVGDKAPALTVTDATKSVVNIADLTAEKGLIILFFRSADWCPFCKRHLIEFNEYADKFKALGYGVAAISYDSTDILNGFSKAHQLTYPLLSDQAAATVKAYGILNKDYQMGDNNYGIPYPGVVIINPAGTIFHKYFFEGYRKRVNFVDLYQQLSTIK
ncbi:peroxiredoxin family protein [Colwellia sp. BRX8-7]|jgi:peroxiredoxin|uniref:peroxiredoxin family protein n=1 Tax=Colwellia sp. BRX8-7 TaxID=2759833 RepID=UPI0021751B5B|nr:peroxiredoxin family protein [Colwellia sp. BRX8-7]